MATKAFQRQVAEEIATKKREGYPVAGYDAEKSKAFLEYPNGSKEYVGDAE